MLNSIITTVWKMDTTELYTTRLQEAVAYLFIRANSAFDLVGLCTQVFIFLHTPGTKDPEG